MSMLVLAPVQAETIPFWIHLVERFFVVLTAGVVAFGVLHVEIEFLHWAWEKLKGSEGAAEPAAQGGPPQQPSRSRLKVRRFDRHQRIQHFLLLSSFIVLAVTGIPQKFYAYGPFDSFIALLGGMEAVRLIHRVAAGVMIADGFYHLAYLVPGLIVVRGAVPRVQIGRWLEMIPNKKDFLDFFRMIGHYLGKYPEPPLTGRFTYMEKFDYWAVFWGIIVMAGSGIIMLLPVLGLDIGNTAVIAAALAAHSDEAILAVGWIVLVHFYHAHFSPRVFPFNTTIFTGEIPLRLLQEEHPLEYARLQMDLQESTNGSQVTDRGPEAAATRSLAGGD